MNIPANELLLQQPPILMVDALTGFSEHTATTRFTVPASGVFVQEGELQAYGLLENIAQTCAARIGYINKYILHRPVKPGMLAAIKSMTTECLPHAGEVITTEVELLEEAFGMSKLSGTARSTGGEILMCAVVMMDEREGQQGK